MWMAIERPQSLMHEDLRMEDAPEYSKPDQVHRAIEVLVV